MAATTPLLAPKASQPCLTQPPNKITSIKTLAESPGLTTIPSKYIYSCNFSDQVASDHEYTIPVIDYSLLISANPNQRSQVIYELGKACEEWGFFMVINHGVPESLVKRMIDVVGGFFNLTEGDKLEFTDKGVFDPIRCGTSFNASMDTVLSWKDFLKVFVHPEFHSPNNPPEFRGISSDYVKKVRGIARELLRGISESLGLEKNYIDETLKLESGLQVIAANFYPPCPQPALAMGMVPHSDHGLLTLLIQNGIDGLQVKHKDKWFNVNAIPNSLLVNTGDHLEILSNGKYKSVLHRAVVHDKTTRISVAMAHGPCLDAVVTPAPKLLADAENHQPAYIGIKYKDYLQLQQSSNLDGKSNLDCLRV
ncbi:putative Leucoanthocyanidin dioxygenase [Tripterygium wilfordii]|uniref:Putative Leucoanthocyanidin dioxygenase n=1 Tax=Tripterygium wilfordii TaxID=458696 RepID=A0A7J7CDB5_TRIWF|nr:protein DMR6-LIKE OXYGENASE 2-like [Tripterygium wilfordii]KAF5731925.1 putative Leucoanthocyanidin dioxygenase [Tripterygium wilfordii]